MKIIFSGYAPQLAGLLIISTKAAVLLALAAFIRMFPKRVSSSTRYFLAFSLVVIAAALPLLSAVVPDYRLSMPADLQAQLISEFVWSPNCMGSESEPNPSAPGAVAEAQEIYVLPTAPPLKDIVLFLWLLGTAVAAGRVLVGLIQCARAGRLCEPLNSKFIIDLANREAGEMGLQKMPHIRVSRAKIPPHVYGIIKPVLVLPQAALRWPKGRLLSVLQHELAHLKRNDNITWPLANLAASWLWFVPFLWIALAQMKHDKEKACDDYVISRGNCKISYARYLLEAYAFMRATIKPLPINPLFSQKSEIKERITCMLKSEINHRPLGRKIQIALFIPLLIMVIPFAGIAGFSNGAYSQEVAANERGAVMATLTEFFAALSDGSDYQSTRDRFLTADYFNNPNLTLESLDKALWRPVFDNTLRSITEGGPGITETVRARITSVQREKEELVVTLQLEVAGYCLDKKFVRQEEDGKIIFVHDKSAGKDPGAKECLIVNSLSQPVRFRLENNLWKISRFGGGVDIMRMDTNNPHGPIFLVWIEDINDQTTPFGAQAFKVVPRDVVPYAHNTQFLLVE